ncbi:MAG: asparagine synthase (glutamine-hydrolyzing) [Patescibacteria group bacterium]|nr:asparagine synthase (glutamine-hydrolyzing) [Patescibacteria group bacterium]
MCGIAVIAGKQFDKARYNTSAMLEALRHRGPDGQGEQTLPHCWLGHRRLSIIDIGGGGQPMVDNELSITFNGEIYNYKELRSELQNLGHQFKTHSDTEVILKAYRQWGGGCPKKLDGMFAFALWDERAQTLFLARDRFGKKPLYYTLDGSTLLIASELKALRAGGRMDPEFSLDALDNYLRLMYIPPWKSVYKYVLQIPPAHCATFKNGRLAVQRYWALQFNPIDISYGDAKAEVKRLLGDAVKKRMLAADVEVGALLSGGVDSTIVSLLAQEHLKHPLKTFSLGYGEYINELPFAEEASKAIHSDHYTAQAHADMTTELERVIAYFDEPHADTSDFPQHLVSQLAASKVKVALSGDGGDELFLGYGWHTRHNNLSWRAHTFEKLLLPPFAGRVRATRVFKPLERMALWGSPILSNDIFAHGAYDTAQSQIEKINAFDLTTYLPGQLLSKVDRTGMMHGLEVRSPLLDTALAEFVCNLPTEYKTSEETQKHILKDILSERMPKKFVYRRKQGFGAPATKWLREHAMGMYARDMLGPSARIRSLLRGRSIDWYLRDFFEKGRDRAGGRLWILLCLELWLRSI